MNYLYLTMKATVFAILALGVLVQADRDLSSFRPNNLNVIPRRLPLVSRVVGGEEAKPHQYPHQVALFIQGGFFCGGSVIDAHSILTAAHCVDAASYAEVLAGAHNIRKLEDSQQVIKSYDIVVHPGWDRYRAINDVAIIRLPKPLELNEYVKTIELYGGDSALVGEEATISGWGKDSDSAPGITNVLRHVTNTVITNEECGKTYGDIANSIICLSGSNGKSSCSGDSGGPLIHSNNGVKEQVGIVSFGNQYGCEIGFPTAYSRVSSFKDWVNENRSQ